MSALVPSMSLSQPGEIISMPAGPALGAEAATPALRNLERAMLNPRKKLLIGVGQALTQAKGRGDLFHRFIPELGVRKPESDPQAPLTSSVKWASLIFFMVMWE